MKVASFFAGCGGLDLGFEQAGYEVVWANEFDESIYTTYELNHPNTILCKKSIRDVQAIDIPNCDGFIGGPPCQAWSEAGKRLGLEDERGKVFLDYIRLIKDKQPKFFLIENVKGLISEEHIKTFEVFILTLQSAGYNIHYKLLDAVNFCIPQNRERVFIVGIRKDINCIYEFPKDISNKHFTLRDAIGDINIIPNQSLQQCVIYDNNEKDLTITNHDVYIGPFSQRYMARNRVRTWEQPSFTIPASASNVPIHPQALTMEYVSYNKRAFRKGKEYLYRRLSIRECARIQTFPDSFKFLYKDIKDGYKMVGNAVPPRLAKALAISIASALQTTNTYTILVGYVADSVQLEQTRKNKLYYIRRGNRPGALKRSEISNISYILLHDSNKQYLFSVSKASPFECKSDQLKSLGFTPHGHEYWGFKIISELNISHTKMSLNDDFIYASMKPRVVQIEIS